jgi:assimilatory nitrate reductase catalytic subunit
MEQVDWDIALRTFVDRMKAIQNAHGPHSIAFLSTGQIVTEEMALLGALAKFGMGMVHGDGNTRQCMATAVTAYKESFGFDAPPYTYDDFEQSDVIVLIGSNLCIAHPILWQRVMQNRHQPGGVKPGEKLIVSGVQKIRDGSPVAITAPAAPATPAAPAGGKGR